MCGVIVVDAGRSRSTKLGRDAYIMIIAWIRHNYLKFYQLPNSNLFTHRMLFFSREATSEIYGPRVYSLSYLSSRSIFIRFYFEIYYSKNPKIPCCTFSLFILFCVIARSIYPIYYKTIYLLPGREWQPLYASGCKYLFFVCRYRLHSVAGSPTGLIPWFHNWGKYLP